MAERQIGLCRVSSDDVREDGVQWVRLDDVFIKVADAVKVVRG